MIEVFPYSPDMDETWDRLCDTSVNGTFLHSRRYLAHQESRFRELSLVALIKGKAVGLLVAAESVGDTSVVVSHPGLTYGGLVCLGNVGASEVEEIFVAAARYYSTLGYTSMSYRAIPTVYHQNPAEDDEFVLQKRGATIERVQLNCVVDLGHEMRLSSRKRRNLKKAEGLFVETVNTALVDEYFHVLRENLDRKYGASPVHSASQIAQLADLFPSNVGFYFALDGSSVLGGSIVFKTPRCWHAQYIAMSEKGSRRGAVDCALTQAMIEARGERVPFFSLGVSNDPVTGLLNESLYSFKREFGGGGLAQRTWSVNFGEFLDQRSIGR